MQSLIITNLGETLISRLIAGTDTAMFTKISASDHNYSGVDLKSLTELEDVKQTVFISGITRVDTTLIEVVAAMDNTKLEAGYYTRALGVYAEDQDGNELLFGVSVELDAPSYLPPFSGKTVSSISYRLNIKVNNSEQVKIEVNPGAYPTIEQFERYQQTISTHALADMRGEGGVHGVRYFGGKFQIMNDSGKWVGVDAATLNGKSADEFAAAKHVHKAADISGLPTSLPANGGNADTVGGVGVVTTSELGLHRMACGSATATSANCPPGCLYGQW